jgi:sugar O-acyltransferase (sialic acid O-acetyltransferase NeuD family)
MAKVVVFGTGSFAECVNFYLTHDSPHEVVAFTVHRDHISGTTQLAGLPVVPFEDLADTYPPDSHDMYVAVGYARVNRVRAAICEEAKSKGYSLISYISSKATTWGDTKIGENVFIFEDNTIQPFVTIGDDCVLWSGNHVGHHAQIGAHCFITSHVVISGHVKVGPYCFIGVNATVRDAISIGEANVIGSAALIMKSTKDAEVYIAPRTKPDARTSEQIGM